MNAYITNIARIVALSVVTVLAGLLAHANIHLGTTWSTLIATAIAAAVAGVMFKGLTWLEKQFPWLAIILPVKHPAPPSLPPSGTKIKPGA